MIPRITHGWLTGHRISTARRPVRCDYWTNSNQCPHIIEAGERYVEGDPNGTPGWGADRICARHAGLLDPESEYGVDAERQLAGANCDGGLRL